MLITKEYFAILYVTMADFFNQHPALANWRNSNHATPASRTPKCSGVFSSNFAHIG